MPHNDQTRCVQTEDNLLQSLSESINPIKTNKTRNSMAYFKISLLKYQNESVFD